MNSVNFDTDNLCFFRWLYLKLLRKCKDNSQKTLSKSSNVSATLDLLNQYANSINADSFKGVTLQGLPLVEKIFNIRVTVYTLDQNKKSRVVFQSFSKSLVHLDLCLVGNHFCYISDLSQFTNSFCCAICSQCFTNKYRLQRHKVQCAKSSSRLKFGNGIFYPPKNIFENWVHYRDWSSTRVSFLPISGNIWYWIIPSKM